VPIEARHPIIEERLVAVVDLAAGDALRDVVATAHEETPLAPHVLDVTPQLQLVAVDELRGIELVPVPRRAVVGVVDEPTAAPRGAHRLGVEPGWIGARPTRPEAFVVCPGVRPPHGG